MREPKMVTGVSSNIPIREAPEQVSVNSAAAFAEQAVDYANASYTTDQGVVFAILSLASQVEALREVIGDRLDLIGEVLAEIRDEVQ